MWYEQQREKCSHGGDVVGVVVVDDRCIVVWLRAI
jgi:hypothetical protein